MNAAIELPVSVNRHTVERAFRRAREMQAGRAFNLADQGMRAAREGDPKMMLGLEQAIEVMDKLADQQMGRTRRDWGTEFGMRAYPTEAGIFRMAYETADSGQPHEACRWIYAAIGELVGVVR